MNATTIFQESELQILSEKDVSEYNRLFWRTGKACEKQVAHVFKFKALDPECGEMDEDHVVRLPFLLTLEQAEKYWADLSCQLKGFVRGKLEIIFPHSDLPAHQLYENGVNEF